MRFITSCCFLLALAAPTALAQTHPKKKPVRKQAVVRKQFSPRVLLAEREPWPYFAEDLPTVAEASDTTKVYTYVEQMPLLNGQHAYLASSAAISRTVVVPANAPTGRVYVQFIVTQAGLVSHPHIVKSLRADVDSAVVAATRQLPRLTPGKQRNRVVAVVITVGVAFPVAP